MVEVGESNRPPRYCAASQGVLQEKTGIGCGVANISRVVREDVFDWTVAKAGGRIRARPRAAQ